MKVRLLVAVLTMLSAACGRTSQQGSETIEPAFSGNQNGAGFTGGASPAAADLKCESKDKCPKADIAVKIDGGFKADSKELLAELQQKIEWKFEVLDRSGSGRKGLVIVRGFESGFEIDKTDERVVVKHEPFKKKDSGKGIVVLARDLERCMMNLGREACRTDKELSEYDKKHELTWRIIEEQEVDRLVSNATGQGGAGATVRVSDPTCGGFRPTSNGEIMMNGLQTGLGVLTGILSGSPQGMIGAVVPIIGGMVSGSGNAEPTEC